MKAIRKHLRLLPAVIAMAGMLLAVKSVGFAIEARADDTAAPAQADTPAAQVPAQTDPAADDSESSSASEVDVLTSLSKRRAELDAEAQDIANRQALLQAAEQRVDGKIADLKNLQSEIEKLLGQRDAEAQKQLDALVKTYSSMKPKDAARIFNSLNDSVLLAVAGDMKPDVLAAVLAAMNPDAAQKLTVKLADKLKLPEEAAPPAAPPPVAQTDTAAPAPATPATDAAPKPAGG